MEIFARKVGRRGRAEPKGHESAILRPNKSTVLMQHGYSHLRTAVGYFVRIRMISQQKQQTTEKQHPVLTLSLTCHM